MLLSRRVKDVLLRLLLLPCVAGAGYVGRLVGLGSLFKDCTA